MKTFLKTALLLAGLAAALPTTHAAQLDNAGAVGGKHHRALRALVQKRSAARQHIARRLGLTDAQKAQLKAARADAASKVKSIRNDASLTVDQKKAKARETIQAARGQMRTVLTADQQAKLAKVRAHLRKAAHRHRGHRRG